MIIKEARPRFVDLSAPLEQVEVHTMDELMNVDWIERKTHSFDGRPFHKLSRDKNHLLAEYDGGTFWWVIGIIVVDCGNIPLDTASYKVARLNNV